MEPIIIEEFARMLEDVAEERGRREGEQIGRREGEQQMGRRTIVDLAEAYGLTLDERRHAWIASASLEELEQVRVALKRDHAWPD
jgi:predicted transposase YdaD